MPKRLIGITFSGFDLEEPNLPSSYIGSGSPSFEPQNSTSQRPRQTVSRILWCPSYTPSTSHIDRDLYAWPRFVSFELWLSSPIMTVRSGSSYSFDNHHGPYSSKLGGSEKMADSRWDTVGYDDILPWVPYGGTSTHYALRTTGRSSLRSIRLRLFVRIHFFMRIVRIIFDSLLLLLLLEIGLTRLHHISAR